MICQALHFAFNDKIIWKMKMLQQTPGLNPWRITLYNRIFCESTQNRELQDNIQVYYDRFLPNPYTLKMCYFLEAK